MTVDETIQIAEEFVRLGISKIRLTGGEPLVKKGADTIIRALGKMPVELSLTTNGILVDRFIDCFKDAGIKTLNVSLDSLKEERFNAISRRSYFSKIKENISLLLNEGFQVKINVVLIKGTNDDEIIDFVKWTENEEIAVQFIEFMPFDGNQWNSEKTVSEEEILNTLKRYYGTDELVKLNNLQNSTSRNYAVSDAKGTFGIISTVTNPFCDSCNRIRLTADGKIKNCLFSNEESDLLSAIRKGEAPESVIRNSILAKHASRGGLNSFENDEVARHENRSMITIGG